MRPKNRTRLLQVRAGGDGREVKNDVLFVAGRVRRPGRRIAGVRVACHGKPCPVARHRFEQRLLLRRHGYAKQWRAEDQANLRAVKGTECAPQRPVVVHERVKIGRDTRARGGARHLACRTDVTLIRPDVRECTREHGVVGCRVKRQHRIGLVAVLRADVSIVIRGRLMEEAAAAVNNVPSSLLVPMIMGTRAMLPSRNNSSGDLGKFRPSVTGRQRKPPPLVPLSAMKSCAFLARRQERTVAGSVQPYRVASATPASSACGSAWMIRQAPLSAMAR